MLGRLVGALLGLWSWADVTGSHDVDDLLAGN